MGKKIKKYKVGLDSETYKISMVTEPAIEIDYVALEKQDDVEVKLSSDERHICYGPALIPNKDIYRNNGEQEFYINFTEESIVKMSQEFLKEYKQHEVNLQHETNADEVFVCESWIVEDPYKDKANALGFNVPSGTWMIGMKVNNIEVWDKVKSGELKGFSVESAIRLEEFSKNDNNMEIKDEMSFWTKMKDVLSEVFSSVSMQKQEEEVKPEPIEPIAMEDLEAQTPTETVTETPAETVTETPTEAPKAEEVVETPKEVKEEVTEPQNEPTEAPKEDTKHLEELINSMKDEIAALRELNSGFEKKIKELSKQPSAKPISTVGGKGGSSDTYAQWRSQMAQYLGY